eukprot:TRINITY_DN3505_c0_g1_i1.p1 TRINITY_DN3505_c0_g1~~TRINITY_DN3505_c0_g1_i1.p1  ORF type:complete len:329 (+),score=80.10 TRINITY_DN3505_c0_g1_i1:33-989(+)
MNDFGSSSDDAYSAHRRPDILNPQRRKKDLRLFEHVILKRVVWLKWTKLLFLVVLLLLLTSFLASLYDLFLCIRETSDEVSISISNDVEEVAAIGSEEDTVWIEGDATDGKIVHPRLKGAMARVVLSLTLLFTFFSTGLFREHIYEASQFLSHLNQILRVYHIVFDPAQMRVVRKSSRRGRSSVRRRTGSSSPIVSGKEVPTDSGNEGESTHSISLVAAARSAKNDPTALIQPPGRRVGKSSFLCTSSSSASSSSSSSSSEDDEDFRRPLVASTSSTSSAVRAGNESGASRRTLFHPVRRKGGPFWPSPEIPRTFHEC